MAKPEFQNENQGRCYPLRDNSTGRSDSTGLGRLDNAVLCDFGCVLGLDSRFDREFHYVHLDHIHCPQEGVFQFVFNVTSRPDSALTFTRLASDKEYAVQFSQAQVLAPQGPLDCGLEIMEGFLVTGDLTWLITNLFEGEYLRVPEDEEPFWVEPRTVTDMTKSRVRSVNVANLERTRVASSSCGESLPFDPSTIHVHSRCHGLPLRFVDGHNCRVGIVESANTIVFTASPGTGKGHACDPVLLFPDEESPRPGGPINGGYGCDEVVTSLGGAVGASIKIEVGRGLRVTGGEHIVAITGDPNAGDACG